MLKESPAPMNAAQRAWATRRAKAAARADQETLKAGVEAPSPALKTSKPVVDINIDHHAIGCGTRRYVVLDCGPRLVRLFYYPTLTAVTIDRLTFDRKAKYARDAKRDTIARIIRQNQQLADKINNQAKAIVMPDGAADAVKALEVLR
jgi:hypothetical protein